jgi:hypothetical protein
MSSTAVHWTSHTWLASRSCLQLANREGLATVAFPAISCGVYAFPYPRAAKARVPALTRLWVCGGLALLWRSRPLCEVPQPCIEHVHAAARRGARAAE